MTLSKPDLDFQKHVNVPEKWIENAIKIPQITPIKPKVMLFPRRMIAAASIVLVVALSISTYFFFGNKEQLPVAPFAPTVGTETPTEYGTAAPTKLPTESPSTIQSSTAPTTAPATQIATDSTTGIVTPATENTQEATEPVSPTDAVRPPTVRSTTPAPKPTARPTQAPVVKPTKTQTEHVTEAPQITEDIRTIDIRVSVEPGSDMIEAAADSADIYCRVYDCAGNLLGDKNLYSGSHLADFSVEGGGWQNVNYIYSYTGEYDAANAVGNRFTYEFYTARGVLILTGTVTVNS